MVIGALALVLAAPAALPGGFGAGGAVDPGASSTAPVSSTAAVPPTAGDSPTAGVPPTTAVSPAFGESPTAVDAGGPATLADRSASSADATASGALAASATQSSAAQDDPTVVERVVYRQRPDGELEAEVVYELPDGVTELEFRFDEPGLEVASTTGFERTSEPSLSWSGAADGPTFAWDGETAAPRVVVRHDATLGEPASRAGGTDDWAVVRRPPTHARWRYDGPEPSFAYDADVDGEGIAGEQFFALGPHAVHETTADGERIRLVVPEAADMASEPDAVLAAVADASRHLRVGERSDVVTIVASPSEAADGVRWAHRGLSLGPDARVNANVPVDDAPSLWIHEYVHTRQDRSATTPSTEWLVEATAEYYAATVAYERGDVDYEAYRDALADGASGATSDAVLAEPDSWQAQAQYHKGALVVAAIDRELRASTDGRATFQDVVRTWNRAEEFDGDDMALRVDTLAGTHARAFAERHATTSATPEPWTRRQHLAIFDVDPDGAGAGESGDGTALASTGADADGGSTTLRTSASADGSDASDDGSRSDGAGRDAGGSGADSGSAAGAARSAAGDALEAPLRQLRRSAGLAMVAGLLAAIGLFGLVARP